MQARTELLAMGARLKSALSEMASRKNTLEQVRGPGGVGLPDNPSAPWLQCWTWVHGRALGHPRSRPSGALGRDIGLQGIKEKASRLREAGGSLLAEAFPN